MPEAVIAAVAGSLMSGVMGAINKPKTPEAPKPEPTVTMPQMDSDTILSAKKKSLQTQMARQGRASTILSQGDNTDKLGG